MTCIEARATRSAAYTASMGLDISGLPVGAITVIVDSLYSTVGAGPVNATLQVQYVTAADFSAPKSGPAFNLQGPISPGAPVTLSIMRGQMPSLPAGQANGKVRVALTALDANATITFSAWT